jgi:hypothetical protein
VYETELDWKDEVDRVLHKVPKSSNILGVLQLRRTDKSMRKQTQTPTTMSVLWSTRRVPYDSRSTRGVRADSTEAESESGRASR